MVARAWPVSVEVIQDWLLPRVKRAHPHVSMTLLSWDIPLISFNGSLWDVLLRCSKWLLGAWLDSFTMILRCWLVVWVKWARPLVSMTLWSRVMFNWKAVSSQWGNFGTLLPPRGASFTPLCGMFLQSPSASSNVANFTFLRNPLSELWVCEFWLLGARQWLLGRGQCVLRWFRIGCLLPRVKRAHPHVSMTLLSWDIPLISFNGSLWDVLLRCSKWLLGAWLDSFTMILRCWLVVWVKWARPLVSMTLWSRVMFNWKAVSIPFHGPSYTIESQWGNFGTLLPPGVQLLPHFEVWSYRACQPLQVWWFISFYEILALSYDPPKFPHALSMGLFGRLFAPGANIVPPIAYKSHSTPFPIRPHVLTPHSWLCDKNCGRSSAPKKSGRRRIISMTDNNNVLCHMASTIN